MQISRSAAKLAAIILLAACAAKPPPPPPPPLPVTVIVHLQVAAIVNPDSSGRASPVVLRVLQLKSSTAFDAADFFTLYDHEKDTLAADLVARAEYIVRPGEARDVELKPDPSVQRIAFMAAFRDLRSAKWRAGWTVPPSSKDAAANTYNLAVRLSGVTLTVAPSAAPAAGH